jgi:hypothetical protein
MADKVEQKSQKKLTKAEVKIAKKSADSETEPALFASISVDSSPAERSATAAEKQLALHRWKVIFAGVSALIALVTLIVLLLNS